MDPHRFDYFTRRLGTATDRRLLLKGMLAAGLGVGFTRASHAQSECGEGCAEGQTCSNGGCVTACMNHRDCRSKHDDPCVSNNCLDGQCVSAIVDCLPGHECCEGACCPSGCTDDAQCAALDPCLWGRCGLAGQCEFTALDPCIVCVVESDCLGGDASSVCCDGACRRPCPDGTIMGKGCECRAPGSPSFEGIVVRDDASG